MITTTKTAAGAETVVFGGFGADERKAISTRHHTVTVEDTCTSFSVDIKIGGLWVRANNATDVDAVDADDLANAVQLRQVGFTEVRVTVAAAGDVNLVSWKDPV